jgi:WD40 repeat protein
MKKCESLVIAWVRSPGIFLYALKFSPDGKLIAVGTGGGPAIFRSPSLELVKYIDLRERGGSVAKCVDWSPDAKLVAAGHWDGKVRVFEVGTWAMKYELTHVSPVIKDDFERRVRAVCFSPDGKKLVSGAGDGSLKVWDITSGNIITVRENVGAIWELRYDPLQRYLVCGAPPLRDWGIISRWGTLAHRFFYDKRRWGALVYDLDKSGNLSEQYRMLPTGPKTLRIIEIEVSVSGRYIVGCSSYVHVWKMPEQELVYVKRVGAGGTPWDIDISPDERYVAVGGQSDITVVHDIVQKRRALELLPPFLGGRSHGGVSFSPDGTMLAVAYAPGAVVLYRLPWAQREKK